MNAFVSLFRIVCFGVLLATPFAGTLHAAERIPPAPKRYFTDETRTVSAATAQRLNARLEDYERRSSNQLLVALYPRMESKSSVADYTVRIAEAWRVGQKGRDNGAVLFVFKQDRELYLQVGYGLEASLTDAEAHRIVEQVLKPRFRAGDFDGGLSAAVEAMIAATEGEFKGTGRTVADSRRRSGGGGPAALVSIIVIIFFVMFFVRVARQSGSRGSGPVIYGGPRMHRRSTIGWGGPRIGGGFGGGGGFSGGGGRFGGGGAGGRW